MQSSQKAKLHLQSSSFTEPAPVLTVLYILDSERWACDVAPSRWEMGRWCARVRRAARAEVGGWVEKRWVLVLTQRGELVYTHERKNMQQEKPVVLVSCGIN